MKKRVSNIWDSQEVRDYIKKAELSGSRKNLYGQAYKDWCKWKEFDFEPDRYKRNESLPYIPSEKEIDQLIGAMGKKLRAFLQLMKESAFRPSEAHSLKVKDIQLERKVCTLNTPSKNSRPRQFKMSDKLIAMITPLIKKSGYNERIFNGKLKTIRTNFYRSRRRLAKEIGNPNLMRITFKTLRHWKATVTYHQTKDILYVQNMLGHKSIKSTMVYTHLVDFEENEQYIVKVAKSLDEFTELLEKGFEYISEFEDMKVLRKRK
ncbi:tyrosine-type recombinase/integrase [Candidatus Bathyarchaeota archaeon]|nr:tyrosine-type recombinase/integrase [Candidatus Bathyarchaeota archaeon]